MTFEPAALLIGLREGLEALLILGILLGMLHRLGQLDKRRLVWLGALGGVVASVLAGLLVQAAFQAWFEDTGAALFEFIVALTAVGILTYMVLWMQKHTTQLLATVKRSVSEAASTGRWGLLAALAFFTVFREGIEVVLFFAARSTDVSWPILLLSGLIGFAISAVLAYAIFRFTVQVRLRAFFGITGGLLIFVAAGLLIHIVHAMADLGWIGHGTPLWDTSRVLPDEDHWLGGPLHALIGYVAQPTALQLMVYLGYIIGVGGWYMASLRPEPIRHHAQWTAMILVILVLVGFAFVAAAPSNHDENATTHGRTSTLYADDLPEHLDHKAITAEARQLLKESGKKVGILIRSHGEPVHYNATTYQSFKEFINGIWPYTGLPAELLTVDQGTYYIDDVDPFGPIDGAPEHLVDAWLGDAPLPGAVPVTDPLGAGVSDLAGGDFYFLPGPVGAGWGEGDLYEIFGLSAYRTWLKMENESPKYEQTKDHMDWMQEHLSNHFGDQVKAVYAYHIDPHTDPALNLKNAIAELVAWGPDVILDSYHSSVFSDAMNTCMMRPHAMRLLEEAGYTGPVIEVGMAGLQRAWGEGVAAYLAANMDHFDEAQAVSVYLAQHGGNPASQNPCGSGGDQYHKNANQQFELAKDVIESHFGKRFTVRQVYGQGGDEAEGEPENGVLSPMEAIELDKKAGIDHVIIIPYEFWSDAMDNLVPLRESLGMTADEAPYYDSNYETHVTRDGVHVDVWSAHYGVYEKGTAHLAAISEAMVAALA